jgi:hypothetical protein
MTQGGFSRKRAAGPVSSQSRSGMIESTAAGVVAHEIYFKRRTTTMKRYSFVFLLLMLMVFPISAQASELFGTVWYKGKPLPNAEITVKDKKVQTNAHGYYSIKLDPGVYTLGIKLPDGRTKEEKVDVFPQDTEKNLKLE